MTSSDSEEDTGRRESEAALKGFSKPAWLSEHATLPLDDLRASMQDQHETLLATPLQDLIYTYTKPPTNPTTQELKAANASSVQTATALLDLYNTLATSTTAATTHTPNSASLQAQIEDDKARLAQLLDNGRKAVAAERGGDGVGNRKCDDGGQQGTVGFEQMREIFGLTENDGRGVEDGEGVEGDLMRVEKVVKRVARILPME